MLERELAVALDAARAAAAIVMDVYAQDFAVEFKGRNDPVTIADRRANESIERALRAAFPDDGICAEEAAADESLAAARRGGRCWFVDPLDGTREFVARNGEFCVMIGLAIDGEPRLGAVVAPVWKKTFWGVVNDAAFVRDEGGADRTLDAKRARVAPGDARMVVSRSHRDARIDAVAALLGTRSVRPCGSVGLKALLVAEGAADLYVHAGRGPKLWDGCAPDAIARAAGAVVSDGEGRPLRYDAERLALDAGIVIAVPSLHGAAVAAFGRTNATG